MFLYCWLCIFSFLKFPKVRYAHKTENHLSMAYSLSNICTKTYWNRTTTVEIIVGGWVVYFFWDTVYISFSLSLYLSVSVSVVAVWNCPRSLSLSKASDAQWRYSAGTLCLAHHRFVTSLGGTLWRLYRHAPHLQFHKRLTKPLDV